MRYLVTCIPTRKVLTVMSLSVKPITQTEAKAWTDTEFKSLLWHETAREVTSKLLGVQLGKITRREAGKPSVQPGDELLVCEYTGPDFPPGATEMPDGGKMRWLVVEVLPPCTIPTPLCKALGW